MQESYAGTMRTMEKNKGSLADTNVLELLMAWHAQGRSGQITVRKKQVEKTILMRNGCVVRAQSSEDQEKLGQILLKRNLVSKWDLDLALKKSKTESKRLGQTLLGMLALKEAVLNTTLMSQTRDIIYSVLDWEEGEYELTEDVNFEHEVIFDQLYTPEILLQGMRRISNIVLLLRPLGDLQAKLRLAADYLEKIRKITLLTEEKSILALLHKPSSLQDLMTASGMEKMVIYRSVAALLAVGVVVQDNTPDVKTSDPVRMNLNYNTDSFALPSTAAATRIRTKRQLGEMLVGQNIITEQQLKEALNSQTGGKGKKQHLGTVLVQKGFATEEAIIECLSGQLNIKKIENIDVAEDVLKMIPYNLAKKYFICPIRKHGSALEVAMLDPTNMAALDDLSFVTGYRIKPLITTNKALKEAWEKSYQLKDEKAVEKYDRKDEGSKRDFTYRNFSKEDENNELDPDFSSEAEGEAAFRFDVGELESLVSSVTDELQVLPEQDAAPLTIAAEDAPIVKLVNTILRQAIITGSSDIHIEPWENKLQIRFRLDGLLHKVMTFPISISNALISRVKILATMDIAERRRPQDGRVKLRMGKRRVVDYRVSVVPSVYGERVVLRVLDRSNLEIDLTKLGFDGKQLDLFKKAIQQPYGMILCTGPTGSGKTTTLYSALNHLDSNVSNILTAEDPVEYNFPGIAQVQINEQIGVTFANVLRSFLRQDPDIIMVGEIRDSETAEICAKAALTGHLVLSTVHTNDAPSAIGRLIDLGLKPYLVSASLLMVVAQRLLRKICLHCKTEAGAEKNVLIDAGFTEEEAESVTLYAGVGCDACGKTGFFGRSGIFEIMPITRRIKSAIAADLPADQIKDIAISEGMKDLRRASLEKVMAGVTTLEEALHHTLTE